VTWNDYEEGTEIETGIDNCVSVSASVSGSTLNWSITGNENTLDHYSVFISNDGQNLMSLGDFPTSTHSLDLSSYGFPSGTYSLYVKTIGKPSILNHLSAAASYTSGGGGQPQPPAARLTVSPGSGTFPITVTASTSASTDPQGSALTSTINFGDGARAAGPTASHTYSNAGNYAVTATVTDALNLQSQATATVSVTASANPTLNVIQPQNNSSSASPIHVVANGSAPSGVDAMQIYLDGTLVYQINAASFDTTVPAGAGTHAVVVKLWDKLGNAYKKSVTVTVTAPLEVALAVAPKTLTLGSSVQATLTATAGTIGSSFIYWGDGSYSSGLKASHAYASTGTYAISARAADSANAISVGPVSVTVQPKTGVVMQSPIQNSVVPLSMHVQGYSSSPIGIVAMQIYVDGALVYQNALNQVDAYLTVSTGTHLVTLKAWDSAGAAYMQTATVTAN
jgi:hypothetical protein